MESGVYAIFCAANGKCYVGSAVRSMRRRLQRHLRQLRAGRHYNAHLQSAWKKYGASKFVAVVLERCPPEWCRVREQHHIRELRSDDRRHGYNLRGVSGHNWTCSPESRAKMSVARKGRKVSAETRARMSAASRGRTHSEATKERLREVAAGRTHSEAARAKMRARRASAETRAKMSEAQRRRQRQPLSEGHKAKIADARRGKELSGEHRAKLSEARCGKRHSAETRARMAEARRRWWAARHAGETLPGGNHDQH